MSSHPVTSGWCSQPRKTQAIFWIMGVQIYRVLYIIYGMCKAK